MRTNLILTAAFSILTSMVLQGQTTNPFDLLWRLDSGYEAPVPVPAESGAQAATNLTPETPATAPADEIPVPPIVNIPEPLPDTPLTSVPIPVPDVASTAGGDTAAIDIPAGRETDKADEEETPAEAVPATEPAKPQKPLPPAAQASPLVLVLIFGMVFALLAWVLSLNRGLLKKVYRAALNENFAALLFREQRFATTQYLYYIIYLVFFITGGMFLYLLGRQFGWTAWVFRSIWTCIGLVTVVYLLRHLALNILGSTYPVAKEATQFSFSILLHNILLGVGLIPVTLFLAFGPENINKVAAIAGIVLCCLVYLMRQFRGLLISSSLIGGHPFHFFVYLCAVEILPLFTLIRFFHH